MAPTDSVVLSDARYGGTVRRTVLDNGLRVITEQLPAMRSVCFGVYVGVGSRDEPLTVAGASHFLEHLLFKGTKKRTAWEISSAIEAVGGETNAYTTKEFTCFYARVLDRDLPLAIDVLGDMITSSLLDPGQLETERQVVLEEIAMYADEPDDAVHDLFTGVMLGEHPLGRPILGSVASIEAMQRDALYEFYRSRYQPSRMVVAAAGNLDHDAVVAQVVAEFRRHTSDASAVSPIPPRSGATLALAPAATKLHAKDTEQAHVVLGGAGIDRFDERRYALAVLNHVLGGGMSSRLFQEVREERGLAYSVYSFASQFADTGLIGVYAGCAPQRLTDLLGVVREQLDRVAQSGLSDTELQRGIGMLTGSTVLGLEDTGSRMGRIGKGELLYGDYMDIDELLGHINKVTADDIGTLAGTLLAAPMSVGVIGPVTNDQLVV